MRVTVKTVNGEAVVAELSPSATVRDALSRSATLFQGWDAAGSSFVFRGRVLKEGESLSDAGIVEGSTLILARRRIQQGGPPAASLGADATPCATSLQLCIKRVGDEQTSTELRAERNATLESVIQRLKRQWGVSGVRLVHGGRVLHPDTKVAEAGLSDGMTLFGMASETTAVAPAAAEAAAAALNEDEGSDGGDSDGGDGNNRGPQTSQHDGDGGGEETCRICHGGRELERELGPLFSPCRCRGTVASVHVECLNRWRRMSSNPTSFFACDSCNYRYQIDRTQWASWVESRAATEAATMLLCALMVCGAAVPCYYLSLQTHFVRLAAASVRLIISPRAAAPPPPQPVAIWHCHAD
jgi:hypothetical protein